MNKKLLLIICLYAAIPAFYAQQPYNDAIKLRNLIDINTGKLKSDPVSLKEAGSIIYNYLIAPAQIPEASDYSSIKLMLSTQSNKNFNPFLIKFLSTPGSGETKSLSMISSTMKSIGGLDVTNFADGLAKFLVERVKQELSTSFFERFKEDLDSIEQLKIIFPSTHSALMAIDREIYNYSLYLDLLRDSFQKDLVMLLPHIDKLVNDKSMDVVFSKYPEVRLMFSHALYIVNEFGEGKFPGEVFHNYVANKAMKDSSQLKSVNKYLWPSLATLDLLSQSIRSDQADHYWVSAEALKLLFDDVTFQIYIGLIYHQAVKTPIYFSDKITLDSKLKEYVQKIDELKIIYEPYLAGIVAKGKSIDSYYSAIKEKQKTGKDKPTYQDYYSLFDASINFMEYASQAPFLDKLLLTDSVSNLKDYFLSARSMGNIYVDIYEKQYTSAIVEFTGAFQTLLSKKITQQIEENKRSIKDLDQEQRETLQQTNDDLEEVLHANTLILKYGSLAASIAKAETSDDVKNAIEAAALPAGSSRIKRETPFNVSLNAYPGLFVGYEKIVDVDNKFTLNSYGLTAPVGVAISTGSRKFLGMPCNKPGHWSYSAFVSFIDIGAVAAFRFQNDSVEQVPTIQLQDIFSPGLFFSIGVPKCPLSINMGAQVGPNLREVNVENETGEIVNKYEDNVYWRFSLSVVVDIPILNFYTKAR